MGFNRRAPLPGLPGTAPDTDGWSEEQLAMLVTRDAMMRMKVLTGISWRADRGIGLLALVASAGPDGR